MKEWHLGPLFEFLIMEADQQELNDVATLLMRLAPDYNSSSLKQRLRMFVVPDTKDMSTVSESDFGRRLQGGRLHIPIGTKLCHRVKGIGVVTSVDFESARPWGVRFDSLEFAAYAALADRIHAALCR